MRWRGAVRLDKDAAGGHSRLAPEIIIRLQDVVKVYETGAGGFTAINKVSLDVRRGEFLGIVGKSGAGKTTLLNLISGVSEITSGEVLFRSDNTSNGSKPHSVISIGEMSENEMAVWRGNNVGIVYQSFELLPQLNLLKNIMLPQDFLGTYQRGTSQDRAMHLLDQVELTEQAYKLPAHVSGGQKQRLAIARALVNDPPLIIADEPTGNLDTVTAETVFRVFERLVKQGKTIILVTHDNTLASRFSRLVYISDGRIVDSYDPGAIAESEEIDRTHDVVESVAAATGTGLQGNQPTAGVGKARFRKAMEASKEEHGDAAIELRSLVKTYVNAAGEFPALKSINLHMHHGEFVSIVGKSGCGKSTLLNMLTGIDHPTSGQVLVGGQDIYKMSESERALWRGRNVGIVFQFFQLLPMLTLLENTMLPMDYCDVYPVGERRDRAMELLDMVGLSEQTHKLPASVSSGQQQSAAIARALATDPPIILADEPTGNLDSQSAQIVLDLFRDMARSGKTILLVTHDPSFTKATDRTVILSDGEIVDDLVAQALPLLTHPQMLQVTHRLQRRQYPPSSVIVRQGKALDRFYMIAEGAVDIVHTSTDGQEVVLTTLHEGQFFGEVELLEGKPAIATARAATTDAPVVLCSLDRDCFDELVADSTSTRQMITEVAQIRTQENLARNGWGLVGQEH